MKSYLIKVRGVKAAFDKLVHADRYLIENGMLHFQNGVQNQQDHYLTFLVINEWMFIEEVTNSAGDPIPAETIGDFLANNSHLTEVDEQEEQD